MRPRVVAVSAATLVTAAFLSPISARAAGQNTIYVNAASTACTDSGTGTPAAPYCTLQAGADAANPGDVVNVAFGNYAATTIKRSGTASAPITFTGNGTWSSVGVGRAAAAPLAVSGASYVMIADFRLLPGAAADALVDGGSNITFTNDSFNSASGAVAEPALHVTGAASAVTVQDSITAGGILVDGGSTGTVVTTNRLSSLAASPVSVVGGVNTAITSNTISGCGPSISVTGSATGTRIENNVVNNPQSAATNANCFASSQAYGILVDSASATSTTEDYNDVYAAGAGSTDYNWAGTPYPSAALLYSAQQQGLHDDNSLAGVNVVEHSPLIDSADSAAIGERATDLVGNPRVRDPLVTAAGAGPHNDYDRGAAEFEDPVSPVSTSYTSSATKAPVGATITLHAALTDTWSNTFDYKFAPSGQSTIDAGTSGTASVSFSAPGAYSVTLYVVPQGSGPTALFFEGTITITVVAPATLVPQMSATASGGYGVNVADTGTTDAWSINSVTFEFGDGSPTQTVADGVQAQHTYAKAGTYTITETVVDAGGNTAKTTASFATNALAAGTLVSLENLAPAKSTGIAQAATASMPDNSIQLLAATTGGAVEFTTGVAGPATSGEYVWQAWQPLNQPAVTAKWVGIAGTSNGSSQLIEITSAGTLLHTVRNANGTWQSGGWGSPAGSTGFVHASITAMSDGSAQLVAVTTAGVLMHDIRFANGSWQGWRALSQPGIDVVDASVAGLPDGSSQIVEVTSAGTMKHDIRFSDGHWQTQGWGTPAGATGIAQVSIASASRFGSKYAIGVSVISAVTSQGGVVDILRNADGSWSSWSGTRSGIGNLGTAATTAVATLPDSYVTFAVTAG